MNDDDQVHVGLFDDVGLWFDKGKGKLVWHIKRVQKIIKVVRGKKKTPSGLQPKYFSF